MGIRVFGIEGRDFQGSGLEGFHAGGLLAAEGGPKP